MGWAAIDLRVTRQGEDPGVGGRIRWLLQLLLVERDLAGLRVSLARVARTQLVQPRLRRGPASGGIMGRGRSPVGTDGRVPTGRGIPPGGGPAR